MSDSSPLCNIYLPTVAGDQTTTSAWVDVIGILGSDGITYNPGPWSKRNLKSCTFVIMNTGGTNSLNYQILGSVDGGLNYDVTEVASAALAANTTIVKYVTNYYTHLKVQVEDTTPGSHTTIRIKACGYQGA